MSVCTYVAGLVYVSVRRKHLTVKARTFSFDHTVKIVVEWELACSRNRRALCSVNLVESNAISTRIEPTR